MDSHKIVDKGFVNIKESQLVAIHWCHLLLYISHKATKSMAKLISQSCGELQLAVCLSREDGAI